MTYGDLTLDNAFMQNRELSWMKFNERVLEEAMDETVPLFERLKFVSIFTSNLDEFYMIRVGSLTDQILAGNKRIDLKSGMNPSQQLEKIIENTGPLYAQRDRAFQIIERKLREQGIFNLQIQELKAQEVKYVEEYYKNYISPILSPQIMDARYPFPHFTNKALYIICDFWGEDREFGLVPVPAALPEFILLPGEQTRYILMENVILNYITDIFPMYEVKSAAILSVTRNADIRQEDESFKVNDDYREKMRNVIKKRSRLSPVRLEIQGKLNKPIYDFLLDKLNIAKKQVFISNIPLTLTYVNKLSGKLPHTLKKQLSYPDFKAGYPLSIDKTESMIKQCMNKDVLLFYPYHQMEPFLNLLKESAEDPCVVSIQITIYRLSKHSRIIDHLCTAAENSKKVTVLIELKARFDEKNNIEWAERLEDSGCQVIYGFEGFKVHAKICLITRKDENGLHYITQIGTGNYNEKTANLYSDLSLITANREIGTDANEFFKNMLFSNLNGDYRNLWVAPHYFKSNIIEQIDQEINKAKAGEDTRILLKLNSLTDVSIIQKLSEASQAGIEIILIIRGICCLLPGIPGKTENIKVISIVGRFLEHARIYCFGAERDMCLYIASADMMTRNTSRRVEIACPILEPDIKHKIIHYLDVMILDHVKGRVLQPDGSYGKMDSESSLSINSHEHFIKEFTAQNITDIQETKEL